MLMKMGCEMNLTLPLKVAAAVASTCVLSLAVMLTHFSSPPLLATEQLVEEASHSDHHHHDVNANDTVSSSFYWNVIIMLHYWLKPPYLHLLTNAIIISIVASSKLRRHHDRTVPSPDPPPENDILGKLVGGVVLLDKPSTRSPPQRSDSMEFPDKAAVSARFGNRKPAVKASPEGGRKGLRVAKSKRNDTLEGTWKAITEGRAVPSARHLRKSDTWDSHVRQPPPLAATAATSSVGNGDNAKLWREPSLSQDELNRRVEAFINKFNEEMRLQRQRSLEQHRNRTTIHRGS